MLRNFSCLSAAVLFLVNIGIPVLGKRDTSNIVQTIVEEKSKSSGEIQENDQYEDLIL